MFLAITNRFLQWMIIGIISPIMILMIISKGVYLESVGYIVAVLSAFVVIFELPSGIISDRIGRKKIYLFSLIIFLLSIIVLSLANGFIAICFGFSLFGIARAFSSGSIESDFIDNYIKVHGKEKIHEIITGMSIGETVGLSCGALLGGYLPSVWSKISPTSNVYIGNLITQGIIIILLILLTVVFHDTVIEPNHEKLRSFLNNSKKIVLENNYIKWLFIGILLWGFSFGSIETYWQPQLKEILGSQDNIIFGIINSGYFITSLLGSILIGFLMIKCKSKSILGIGLIKLIIGFGIIGLAMQKSTLGFSIFFLFIMGFNGMISIPESTVLNSQIPESKRASLLSLGSLVMQIGGIIASVLFSVLIKYIPISKIWVISGIIFGCSSILYFVLNSNMKKDIFVIDQSILHKN
jgi:MFS transporter, DHA1 family, quinolone resistance protein